MKGRTIFVAALVVVVTVITYYSFQEKDSGKEYEVEIKRERQAKDNFMRSSDESPFGEAKKNFKKLNYFPIELKYRISARLESIESKKIVVLTMLLLVFGCGGERSTVQNPVQLTYGGGSTQSNANMNFQPSVVIGGQPLGKENLVATLMMDIQDQGVHLSVLEAAAKHELALTEDQYLVAFPPPLNTSAFSAMRVAYPKEFLELDDATLTSFMTFYRQLDSINSNLGKRSGVTMTSLSNSKERIRIYDQSILEDINDARKAVKNLKLK